MSAGTGYNAGDVRTWSNTKIWTVMGVLEPTVCCIEDCLTCLMTLTKSGKGFSQWALYQVLRFELMLRHKKGCEKLLRYMKENDGIRLLEPDTEFLQYVVNAIKGIKADEPWKLRHIEITFSNGIPEAVSPMIRELTTAFKENRGTVKVIAGMAGSNQVGTCCPIKDRHPDINQTGPLTPDP